LIDLGPLAGGLGTQGVDFEALRGHFEPSIAQLAGPGADLEPPIVDHEVMNVDHEVAIVESETAIVESETAIVHQEVAILQHRMPGVNLHTGYVRCDGSIVVIEQPMERY
jgi:hypothetical protein